MRIHTIQSTTRKGYEGCAGAADAVAAAGLGSRLRVKNHGETITGWMCNYIPFSIRPTLLVFTKGCHFKPIFHTCAAINAQ